MNIEEISLLFFESFHDQNEGDSAHTAISTALSHAGEIVLPSQLYSIVYLARRKQPYLVHLFQNNDFINFKKLAKDLRILSYRRNYFSQKRGWKPFCLKFKTTESKSNPSYIQTMLYIIRP